MSVYIVIVPFESVINETSASSHWSRLPSPLSFADIRIQELERENYIAVLTIKTSTDKEAISTAIKRTENLLYLLAINIAVFRINFSGIGFKKLEDGFSEYCLRLNSDVKKLIVQNEFRPVPYITIIDEPRVFEFENDALEWNDSWPDWLRTTMELNYLASLSSSFKTRFISHYSALEVITDKLVPKTSSILSEYFKSDKTAKKNYLSEFDALNQRYGLNNRKAEQLKSYSDRLISYVEGAKAVSDIDRIHKALCTVGINTSIAEIKMVREQRGCVVHDGKSDNPDKGKQAANLVENWVLGAIRKIIDTKLEVISP